MDLFSKNGNRQVDQESLEYHAQKTYIPLKDEDHFLNHLQSLEISRQDAESETNRLLTERSNLLKRLQLAKEERDFQGKLAMELTTANASLQAKSYELRSKRNWIEEKLNSLLQEEVRLRTEVNRSHEKFRLQELKDELLTTKSRLIQLAKESEVDDENPSVDGSFQKGSGSFIPTHFDIDRLSKHIDQLKFERNELAQRLEIAKQNEIKLKEKHRIEQEKNDVNFV
jgi:hypothetical protein